VLKAITKLREAISGFRVVESHPGTSASPVLKISGTQQAIVAQFFIPDSQFRTENGSHSNIEQT
jgi:hypothetical protein